VNSGRLIQDVAFGKNGHGLVRFRSLGMLGKTSQSIQADRWRLYRTLWPPRCRLARSTAGPRASHKESEIIKRMASCLNNEAAR
jgi:hypothetical protein